MPHESTQRTEDGADELSLYLQQIRQYPRLTPLEERELAQRCAQGDEEAIRRMVNCNLRLVVSVAREYTGRGVPLLDLIQEGSIGLLIAAKRFDPTLDYRFSTYATKWIYQGISKCLASHGLIRVPTHTGDKIRRIHIAEKELTAEIGAQPTPEQLAQRCGITPEKLQQLLDLEPNICSLDAPLGEEEDSSLASMLQESREPSPYDALVREQLRQMLESLLSQLDERQQTILRLRYGLDGGAGLSYAEIGEKLGVSKERVRQIEKQAMQKLQAKGANLGLEDFLE
ncbi:MAG: RNA polymerase sigma factor RpoD/SigA [Firmicutes bacterium]|nr:RNA polymerase sigma factor RpoD/SigA [Bacillota bacterium]